MYKTLQLRIFFWASAPQRRIWRSYTSDSVGAALGGAALSRVAIVVGVLDLTLGNFLKIITLGLLSLGIFNWLLNAAIIQVADWFLDGFEVKNFWWALGLALIVAIVHSVLKGILT